jgi:hypothetical protein
MNFKIFYISIICLFFPFTNLQAQSDEELSEFLHSGNITTDNRIVKIPIEIWNEFILLKVKVNGKNATFLWDNGFTISGIDSALIQTHGFRKYDISKVPSMTDGNNVQVNTEFFICPKIEVKGIKVFNTPFVIIDTKIFTLTKKLKIDGVLGASIINKLNWKFNFDKNFVEVSLKPFSPDKTALILPFKINPENNNHLMSIVFDSINKTECQIDFGYNSAIIGIYKPNAKRFSKAKATKEFGPYAISLGGLAPIDTIYTIKDNYTWELAGKKLDFLPKLAFSKSNQNVVIGNTLFRNHHNVIINSTIDTIYALSKRKKMKNISDVNDVYGYRILIFEGKFKIVSIDVNVNTIKNSIQLMDEVISINGRKPKSFKDNNSLINYQEKLRLKKKKMVLNLLNGAEIEIIPEPKIEFEFKNEKELW